MTKNVVHVCMLSHFSCVPLFATLCTVARQAPLSMGIVQGRMPEWVAMPSSRGSSHPRDRTKISCMEDPCPAEPPRKPQMFLTGIDKIGTNKSKIPKVQFGDLRLNALPGIPWGVSHLNV